MQYLLQKGDIDLNWRVKGVTPLGRCIYEHNLPIMHDLIDAGASPNTVLSGGGVSRTPLFESILRT